jgi:hypothetical protein
MHPMVLGRLNIAESPYSVDAGHFQCETAALRLLTQRAGPAHSYNWYVNYLPAKIGLVDRTDYQSSGANKKLPAHW